MSSSAMLCFTTRTCTLSPTTSSPTWRSPTYSCVFLLSRSHQRIRFWGPGCSAPSSVISSPTLRWSPYSSPPSRCPLSPSTGSSSSCTRFNRACSSARVRH
uniref:Uncharacterized protein n=1 Tax=Cacopsylla melanoneura TaxID=428564 RepID=A0A8D8YND9_9HEMI